jgi:hypothetical protein
VVINNRDAIIIIVINNCFFISITSLDRKVIIFTKSVKNERNQGKVRVIKPIEMIKDSNKKNFFILPPRLDIHSAGVHPTKSGKYLSPPGRMAEAAFA